MSFKKYFEVFICDTEESKRIHHNIRYQVYCEELGYEDKENFPNKQEHDEYDQYSQLFIVRYRLTKEYIAAFRLIHSMKTTLPIEKLCELTEPISHNAREISRVCVLKYFRTSKISQDGIDNIQNSVLFGIAETSGEYCFHKLTHDCYWIVRPALAKLLTRSGLKTISVGKPCEHRGTRYPYKTICMDMINYYHGQFLKCEAYRYYSHLSPEEL